MNNAVLFSNLITDLPEVPLIHVGDARITGIAFDSRSVQSGDLFVALVGGSVDGHRFIQDAVQRGASAVVGTKSLPGLPVPYAQVVNSRRALAYLAAALYGYPTRQLTVIGVTGTDGKTTTANYIYHMLRAAGHRTGMITTVSAQIGDQILDTGFHVTTPEAPDVQRYLAQMVAAGLTHVILEATSHGLAQQRVTACDFDMGVVTNITHEHLDYHGTYEAYRAAKGMLFEALSETPLKSHEPLRAAVLNRDDISFDYLNGITKAPHVSYGLSSEADWRAKKVVHTMDGLSFIAEGLDVHHTRQSIPINTNLVGGYNTSNCLAAVTLGLGVIDLEPEAVQAGILTLSGIPGRMQRFELGQDYLAFVDFAHTPNALRRVLETARKLTSGRVIAVFGSAGLRDRAKRRLMAQASAELADLTVLTAEDPRTESLVEILAEMAAGAEARGGEEGENFWRVVDRGEAIRFALSLTRPGDLVIVCGKGHEQSMCFGEIEYPWDDGIAMRSALTEYLGVEGPEMPYLPTQDDQYLPAD